MKYLKNLSLTALILVLMSTFLLAQGTKVRVVHTKGEVMVLRKNETKWAEAEVGTELFTGDRIKTSIDSSAELSFDRRNKNIVRVSEDTDVYIRLKKNEKIELIHGELFALIKKIPKGRRFEIRTPAAVCGARGTGWGTRHRGKTEVDAFEKASYAKGIDKDGKVMDEEFEVKEGFKRTIERFKMPSRMMRLTDRDYDKWNAWKEDRAERTSRGAGRPGMRKQTKFQKSLEKALERKEEIYEKSDRERIMEKMQERRDSGGTSSGTY